MNKVFAADQFAHRLLPNHPVWRGLSIACVRDLHAIAANSVLGRGEKLDVDVGVVLSGVIADERRTADGRRVFCALYRPGDLVDLRRRERRRQGQLMALSLSRILSFGGDRFDACVAAHPDLAAIAVGQIREQAGRFCDHTADMGCKTPPERVAAMLFEFRRWAPKSAGGDDGIVRLPVPRVDISDYIGIRAETLSRCLRTFEKEGLVELLSHDHVRLADVPSLRRIANGGRPRRSTRVA